MLYFIIKRRFKGFHTKKGFCCYRKGSIRCDLAPLFDIHKKLAKNTEHSLSVLSDS